MRIVLLIILGLLIVGAGGWIAYDQIAGVDSRGGKALETTEAATGIDE